MVGEEETAEEALSYGTDFNDTIDGSAGVGEGSRADTDNQSYNTIP